MALTDMRATLARVHALFPQELERAERMVENQRRILGTCEDPAIGPFPWQPAP